MRLSEKGLKPGRCLILAHRQELIWQAADKVEAVTGKYPEIEMGEFTAARHGQMADSHVVISSIQTQTSGKKCEVCNGTGIDTFNDRECIDCFGFGAVLRMLRFDPMEFSLIVIDEAHRSTADSYRRILKWYGRNPDLKVLGVTATPDRQDETALGAVFDSVAYSYDLPTAINDGWLVPIHQEWITVQGLDFSQCRTTAGDLNNGDIETILMHEEMLHGIVNPTIELAGDRQTLIFAASVAHSEKIAEIINRHKTNAAVCIHGKTNKQVRRDLLKAYSKREFQFLVNCAVFTEGFDEPSVSVVAIARPTKSRALYSQMVGRGTRPLYPPMQGTAEERKEAIRLSPKSCCTVLDFVGNWTAQAGLYARHSGR